MLRVYPLKETKSTPLFVPSSKPETQRAIYIASLAQGTSKVINDLRCLETQIMKNACTTLGSKIKEHTGWLSVSGGKNGKKNQISTIQCMGSGLVARTFAVRASLINNPVIITGDAILRGRVMVDLFESLRSHGIKLEYIGDTGKLPVVNTSTELPGGVYELPGNISSQYITALLLNAPYATSTVEIRVTGEIISASYIIQSLDAMKLAGARVVYTDDLSYIKIDPRPYRASIFHIPGDYTSASYLIAKAVLFPGETTLHNLTEFSLQGERAILKIIQALGLTYRFNEAKKVLTITNLNDQIKGDYEFDATDFPNIVPTLAAISAYVEGRFRVIGAGVTRFHKSSRVEAMVKELQKAGVDIRTIFRNGYIDGFETHGSNTYEGGFEFSSWKDHRNFMSLFIASLRMQKPNVIDGHLDLDCSFPDFLSQFKKIGVKYDLL